MLFNVTTHSWKAVSLRLVAFFSHLWQPFVLYYSVFWYKLRNYFWLYAMNICINIDLEVFLVTSPFGQPLSCRWLHLLLVIESVLSSNPRSSIHCIRLRSTFPVCFFCPNGFFSRFSYRVVYHSFDCTFCRVPYYFKVLLCRNYIISVFFFWCYFFYRISETFTSHYKN